MKTLVLSLVGLTGHARTVLQYNFQKNLYAMGYRQWLHRDGTPRYLDSKALFVNPAWTNNNDNEQFVVADVTGGALTVPDGATVYDAATQGTEFLQAAFNARIEVRWIDGAKVTITPRTVDVDVTDLVKGITQEAKTIQTNLFGCARFGTGE